MPATELLYVFIICIIVALVTILAFTGGLKALEDWFFSGATEIGNAGICNVGLDNDECGRLTTRDSCTQLKNDDQENKCGWCVGFVDGQQVGRCIDNICGCRPLLQDRDVQITVFAGEHPPGSELSVSGKVDLIQFRDGEPVSGPMVSKEGFEVTMSFLDGSRGSTDSLGPEETVKAERDGSFAWTHMIPEDAQPGRYFVLAEFSGVSDAEEFFVG